MTFGFSHASLYSHYAPASCSSQSQSTLKLALIQKIAFNLFKIGIFDIDPFGLFAWASMGVYIYIYIYMYIYIYLARVACNLRHGSSGSRHGSGGSRHGSDDCRGGYVHMHSSNAILLLLLQHRTCSCIHNVISNSSYQVFKEPSTTSLATTVTSQCSMFFQKHMCLITQAW